MGTVGTTVIYSDLQCALNAGSDALEEHVDDIIEKRVYI
jgi:hypothetical protein